MSQHLPSPVNNKQNLNETLYYLLSTENIPLYTNLSQKLIAHRCIFTIKKVLPQSTKTKWFSKLQKTAIIIKIITLKNSIILYRYIIHLPYLV